MIDKKYPTRMHEVLGVETGELFSIYEFADDELAYVDTNGNVLSAKNNIPVGPYTLTVAINHGIIRRPRLSEEQVKQFKALHKALKGQVVDIVQTLRDAGVEVDDEQA